MSPLDKDSEPAQTNLLLSEDAQTGLAELVNQYQLNDLRPLWRGSHRTAAVLVAEALACGILEIHWAMPSEARPKERMNVYLSPADMQAFEALAKRMGLPYRTDLAELLCRGVLKAKPMA